jgi:hypothetical protein
MPKGNPNPKQTDDFKRKRFTRIDASGEPLSRKVRGVKVVESIDRLLDQAFASDRERGAWLRQIITEAAIAQLLPQQQQKARDLLSQGRDPAEVAEATGLSLEILESLHLKDD